MNVALFGGTFDPVHRGHIELARAAAQRFDLKQVHFVPANVPPHKPGAPLTAFEHRYAMLALATVDEKTFLPSLLEAPSQQSSVAAGDTPRPAHGKHKSGDRHADPAANYSIDTVR